MRSYSILPPGRYDEPRGKVWHSALSPRCRSPFGAREAGSTVTLSFYSSAKAENARIRLWYDGCEHFIPMYRSAENMYSASAALPDTPQLVWYSFFLTLDGQDVFCRPERSGCWCGGLCDTRDDFASFQITVCARGFSAPDWPAESVMYQIFPDRFRRSEASCASADGRQLHVNWDEAPLSKVPGRDTTDFFGGNFAGISEMLPYLEALGVNVLYLNPIFKAASNHRYDVGDYAEPDPLLGTAEEFEELCAAARAHGIRVLCDGVFSHTGVDSRYFNRFGTYPEPGAYGSKASKYYPWYAFESYPNVYKCWWNVPTLPELNETEPTYLDFICGEDGIARLWQRRGTSGWRLDVADELPDGFLLAFRRAVKAQDRDALILGEVWEDASNKVSYGELRPYLLGGELDSVMNYPFRTAVLDFLTGKLDSLGFCDIIYTIALNYPLSVFYSLMNFLSTHDTERILTLFGGDELLVKAAALILWSLPGMPCIYYGDELGMAGGPDPANRGTFPRELMPLERAEFFSSLNHVRREHSALTLGSLSLDADGGCLTITREHAGETVKTFVSPSGAAPIPSSGVLVSAGKYGCIASV